MRLPSPYRPEDAIVSECLDALDPALDWGDCIATATPWVQAVRQHPPPFWAVESLLKEYPISSSEGLALMRLAEALLRVPDLETAIALTADQLGRADFEAPHSHPALARLSSAAIHLSKKLLPDAQAHEGLLGRLGARSVVAATLRAVQLMGHQFVLGQTMAQALHTSKAARRASPNLRYSYDMLGEGARTEKDALAYLANYRTAINFIAASAQSTGGAEQNDGISIKLSALHPRFEDGQRERVLAELVPRLWGLCEQAANANISLAIDAEEVDRLELSLDLFDALATRVALYQPQWRGFGLALQSYQTRALALVEHVIAIARRERIRLMCRLVKGAYWDAEVKRAQELGLPNYPVFTHKHHTDIAYLACAKALLAAPDAIYPQFATHNAGTVAAILQMASSNSAQFELQRLHGMGEGLYREVLKNPAIACRVYAPVGAHKDLLAYLVRRLLENGANNSFVHQLADGSVGVDDLLRSPLRPEPQSALALPPQLFGAGRANSAGLDLTVENMREPLEAAYAALSIVPVPQSDAKSAVSALLASASSYQNWSKTPFQERAAMLRQAASALEVELPRFAALLVKEAFKTWVDAVNEVREAVDFLRYYALEAERVMAPITLAGVTGETNELRLKGRGPWVCISPWNFPLAIFIGQVAAALVTGNTVLAKPAEQTPVVALEAVKLLHGAGVPKDALQLLHGPGDTVGAALVAAPGVAGVVFTGSTEVAKHIQRALAAKDGPIVPLIAETGGLNAMLVDSTALPEQVVDAVLQSAFRSAGQRCSALRLLCVHADIAERVITMLAGAAQELVAGDPALHSSDLGPVIDRQAFDSIQQQIARLNLEAKPLFPQVERTPAASKPIANLIWPKAFEIGSVAELKQEIFGPVLHVLRWRGDPQVVIDQINALGYGLTLGIQTRIDSRAQALAHAAHIGNVYINRNQIGAVVGVQPFGGEGLSGTGPKAGGPHYLYRFCAEQTVTVNTTAAGGNAALLAG